MVNYNKVFLVVDDMEGMRRILTNSLNQIGVKTVLTAVNGAEAWRMIQSQPVDVVVSDWNMPVMTGLDLLKKIRESSQHANMPVLMMTAETERHQVQIAVEAGVSGYMVKPFNVGALESKIKRVIEQPRPQALGTRAAPPILKRSSNNAANPEGSVLDPASKPVLLVVDDVPDNLDVMVELLSSNYQVKVASSGERALKILTQGKIPDLILLDVMMPEMDGFEVCRQIKANPAIADIPVIFLTAMSDVTDVTKGFAVGAVDFVTKPADPPILKARIDTHLKLRRSFAELKRNRIALIEKNAVLEDNLRLREEVDRISQHDLKNPVAGIISFATSLMEDPTLADQHKEIIKYIEQSAYSVLNMVHLSLDLYKMEQGSYEFNPNPVDLVPLLQRILKEMASEMQSRELTAALTIQSVPVGTGTTLRVLGDELLSYSMFNNLMKNAMEAARPNTVIQIDMAPVDEQVAIEITNDGAVPAEVRSTFFDKFTTSGKNGGTGLGTFSAQLIAKTQQGNIAMSTSDEQATTTLTVHMPYALHADISDGPI
jgi:two-component system sensor histidine kinase/response regulator